jgi:hypothetical protein
MEKQMDGALVSMRQSAPLILEMNFTVCSSRSISNLSLLVLASESSLDRMQGNEQSTSSPHFKLS